VEMESAALMALAETRGAEIASLLHVTNSFATAETDFEKGAPDMNERILQCCLAAFAEALVTPLPNAARQGEPGGSSRSIGQ